MTKVSVVVPVFNVGALLDETLASVRAQTHRDLEVVVVDDASTDPGTLAALGRAEDDGHRVFRLARNCGLAAARNAGVAAAEGEYVLPLDSDDLIEPTYAAQAAAVLDDSSSTGIVYCRADFFGSVNRPWDLPEFDIVTMLEGNIIFACAMFRKADWQAVGGYPDALRTWEDYVFWLRLLSLGRGVHRIDETLFHYRQRPGQITSLHTQAAILESRAFGVRDNMSLYAAHAAELIARNDARDAMLAHFKRRYGTLERAVSAVAHRIKGLRGRR